MKRWQGMSVLGFLFSVLPAMAQTVLYVDINATGSGNGSTWCDAITDLSSGIFLGQLLGYDQVRVADGTYVPLEDETGTFRLYNGLEIKGGYAGCGAPDPDARDVVLYETMLSGDAGTHNKYHVVTGSMTDSTAVPEGFTITAGLANGTDPDNSGAGMYNEGGSPTVRYCTFRNNTAADSAGAMMNKNGSSPTIENCHFEQNVADHGGAMSNLSGSDPTLTDCVFDQNQAAILGGAIDNDQDSIPVLTRCEFLGNQSDGSGGGLHFKALAADVTVTECRFVGNTATDNGGGASIANGTGARKITFVQCTFEGNTARDGGGLWLNNPSAELRLCKFVDNEAVADIGQAHGAGVWVDVVNNVDVAINNCLFARNAARTDGAGVYFYPETISGLGAQLADNTFAYNSAEGDGGGIFHGELIPVIRNSILWGNSDGSGTGASAQIHSSVTGSDPDVEYSDWQDHSGGTGNIDVNPRFFDPYGLIDCDPENDFFIGAFSQCIDAGKNGEVPPAVTVDLIGTDRTVDDPNVTDCAQNPGTCGSAPLADMGAYEFFPDCDGNSIRDDCDVSCGGPGSDCYNIPGCGSGDQNANHIPDDCECEEMANCADADSNGISDDHCQWFDCRSIGALGACGAEERIFADAGGPNGACPPDGFCNIHDANHALACFSGKSQCGNTGVDHFNIDIGGSYGSCPSDGFCNIHDANHAIACFQGTNTCSCYSCGAGASAPMQGPQVVGAATLAAVPAALAVTPDTVRVRVFTHDALNDLRGYQLDLVVSGGTAGQLELLDITIEPRDDFVFAGRDDAFEAFNVTKGQMLCGLEPDEGVATPTGAYLATYTYRIPTDADGQFVIDFAYDESAGDQTYLIASNNGKITIADTTAAVVAAATAGSP